MPRTRRPLDRSDGVVRDARLIVIASEDTYAVQQYFERFKTKRVKFAVVPTVDCRSSPTAVMARLEKYREGFDPEDGDTFWVCIDRDTWDGHTLAEVTKLCREKEHGVVISNPCFELWLLLHYEDLGDTEWGDCGAIKRRLKTLLGEYGPHCCRSMRITSEMVEAATERARALDLANDIVPEFPCTRLYQIIDLLRAREAIVFE